jgi:predicted lysophospholipase L1 biosynthesis ABC-type transport system permease subunit
LLLSGESLRILPFAIIGIIALERFSWIVFWVASWIFSSQKNISPSRFFLLDALRSFRNSPILGKVSFSVFFLLSATISSVFLFSLAFQDTLKQTTDSQINTFVINLLPKDYEKLSTWIPKSDFYSTIRARIISINGKSLATHLGTPEVSREFSREFNITDGETNKAIIA